MRYSFRQLLSLALVFAMCFTAFYFVSDSEVNAAGETFIIDPGHGGNDPGATNGSRQEKDDTLNMSFKVGSIVSQYASLTYTRTNDATLSLSERCSIANSNGNKYFISIHRNSFSNPAANGLETFYCSNLSSTSTAAKFATAVQNKVMAAVPAFTNRGVKTALFTVITGTNMPACLVELGFISNDNDNALYDNNNDAIAKAIASAMLSMINVDLDSNVPVTPPVTTTNKLDGNSAVDMGKDFYARVEHTASGKYLADVGYDVKACDFSGGNDQVWHFMRQASGAYLVGNAATSKFWNVKDETYANGTNLDTSSATFNKNQKFFIYYIDSSFFFMPEGADFTIDIDAATSNAQIYGSTVGPVGSIERIARSFDLEILSIYDGGRVVSDLGNSFTATIKNVSSNKYLTASGDSLIASNATNSDNQKWNFTRLANGAYTIVSASENKAIDVYCTQITDGTTVDLYPLHGGNAQTFFILQRDGAYYIKSTYTLNALTMDATNLDFTVSATEEGKINAQRFEITLATSGGNDSEELILKNDSALGKEGALLVNVKGSQSPQSILENFENQNAVIRDAEGNTVSEGKTVGTGCTVDLVVNGEKIDSVTIIVKGDITGEGVIDTTDYIRIKSNFIGDYILNEACSLAADVDDSGKVDSTDYIKVKSHFLGNINIYE